MLVPQKATFLKIFLKMWQLWATENYGQTNFIEIWILEKKIMNYQNIYKGSLKKNLYHFKSKFKVAFEKYFHFFLQLNVPFSVKNREILCMPTIKIKIFLICYLFSKFLKYTTWYRILATFCPIFNFKMQNHY